MPHRLVIVDLPISLRRAGGADGDGVAAADGAAPAAADTGEPAGDQPSLVSNDHVALQAIVNKTIAGLGAEGHLDASAVRTVPAASQERVLVLLPVDSACLAEVLVRLERVGVGAAAGSQSLAKLYVLPLEAARGLAPPGPKRRQSRSDAAQVAFAQAASKLRVEQLRDEVAAAATFSLDFLLLLLVAATLAGVGLATDNTVVIVASMLVSPIMG